MKNVFILLKLFIVSLLFFSCTVDEEGIQPNVKFPGVDGPKLEFFDDSIQITTFFKTIVIQGGVSLPLAHMENSFVELNYSIDNQATMLRFNLSYEDIFENDRFRLIPPQSLPDGRPLPTISTGRLPAVALNLPEFHNITIYLNKKLFAIFVPFNIGLTNGANITGIFSLDGNVLGSATLVSSDENNQNGGLFTALSLETTVAKKLKRRVL